MFLSFLEDWDYVSILPVNRNLAGVEGVLVLTSLTATDVFFQNKSSIPSVTQSIAFIRIGCMRKMKEHQTCLSYLPYL